MSVIIGLYGDSRAGKDTVAEILTRTLGFQQRSIADPIREMLLRVDPYLADIEPFRLSKAVEQRGWDGVKKYYPDSVNYMINLGQAARDIIAPDVWLAPVMRDLPPRLVISDVRQPNEYDAIKMFGGAVWKIEREGTVPRGMDRLLEDREFDAVIYNNHSLQQLEEVVCKYARWLIDDSEADQQANPPKAGAEARAAGCASEEHF